MATMQPSPEDIQTFCAFVSIDDESLARQWLAANNNDVNNAIASFVSGDTLPTQSTTYDENAFSQDRYGGYEQGGNLPSFQINDADPGMPFPRSKSPARPSSRASHISGDHSMGGGSQVGYNMASYGQETGVTSGFDPPPYFGPATKSTYDEEKWAMTLVDSTTHELIPDLDPPQRKREGDEPVILKPLASQDYLPALITILHSIPLVRNAILSCSAGTDDFGYNSSWWSGTPISEGGSGTVTSAMTLDDLEVERYTQLIQEMQRLVAFLDESNRSYGSVDALAGLQAVESAVEADPTVPSRMGKFLASLEAAVSTSNSDLGLAKLVDALQTKAIGQGDEVKFSCFTQKVDDAPDEEKRSLYDIFDSQMFDFDNPESNAYITKLAKVFTVRLIQENVSASGVNIEIPKTWYADRYVESRKEDIQQMCQRWSRMNVEVKSIEEKKQKLRSFKAQGTGKDVDALNLLKASINAFKAFRDCDQSESAALEEDGGVIPHYAGVVAQLQAITSSVEGKLRTLNDEKERIADNLKSLTKTFTSPDSSSAQFSYTLHGVSTESNITYIVTPFTDDTSQDTMWWKLEYVYAANQPYIIKTKVPEADVLKAARDEYKQVLLVYVSDDATSAAPIDLPSPLKEFVRKDNREFIEELNRYENPSAPDEQQTDANPMRSTISEAGSRWESDSNEELPDTEMAERGGGASLVAHMSVAYGHQPASDAIMDDAVVEPAAIEPEDDSVVHIENVGK